MASDKDTNVEVKLQDDGGPGETAITGNQSHQPEITDTPAGETATNESMKEIDLREEEKPVETTACGSVATLPVNDKMEQKDAVDDNDNDAKKIVTEAQSVSSNDNVYAPQSADQQTLDSQLHESLPQVIESLSLSDSGVNNDISLDQQSQVGRCESDSINEPKSLTSIPMRHANDELSKFHDLCTRYIESNQNMQDGKDISTKDRKHQTNDGILQFLVTDDLSSIKNVDALRILFTDYLQMLPPKIISEILSVLIAIIKKSVFHLETARGLLFPCIKHLTSSDHGSSTKSHVKDTASANLDACISLTKHFLREWVNLLIAHSCDVDELQSIIKLSETDPSLLQFIQQANLKQRNRPHAFFAFPGTKGSMMSLPPFQKWPNQLGWSFSTWFFLEPKACAQPYLYNFKTGKSGLGYSAHFTGNCLVLTSIRVKGKGVQHCVAYEFPSYKWLHCAITYHNKWRASEIKVYVNGQLTANIEMPWQVQTSESFDKCFIGGSGSITRNDRSGDLNCFCGQMSALYLFNEGLSPAQICALHRLGPSYMGQFKYSNESYVNLPPLICKTLYEEKLASSLFSLFTPVAVDSGTLCIQLAPFKSSTSASAQNYFVSAPHAALVGEARAIITHPICSTLQSLGCSRSLLPLLESYSSSGNSDACVSLIGFLCDLLESSPHWFANEIVQNNVFVIVARALTNNARLLLTDKLLDIFLCLTSTLLTTASSAGDSLLLKHIMDNILFNPSLWVYAEPKVQIKLYHYLASEFLHGTRHGSNRYSVSSSANPAHNQASHFAHGNPSYPTNTNAITDDQTKTYEAPSIVADLLFGEIRRVSTVLQSLHALKYYYWMEEDCNINHKARNQHLRPSRSELATIRSYLLQFTQELIARANATPLDEVQGILNYLSACSRPDNILDVMDTLSKLISEHPSAMVVALDQKQAIKIIFMLIGSCDERVCVKSLRLLSQFLSHCSYKKKQDIMGPSNLFMLLCDRLRIHLPLSLNIYEALIDLMIEEGPNDRCLDDKRPTDLSSKSIINSTVIKVIATLVYEQRMVNSRPVSNLPQGPVKSSDSAPTDIRKIFINDLWNIIVNSRENRRIILQMSVWQHWLINLMNSTIEESPLVKDQILAIFRVLLYHAIRYEYGGWRVWIDTLAIIHAKVSYDEFCHATSPESPYNSKNNIDSNKHQDHNANLKISRSRQELNDDAGDDEDVTLDASEDNDRRQEDSPGGKMIKQAIVSSISEHIVDQSRGIDMTEENDEDKQQVENVDVPDVSVEPEEVDQSNGEHKHELTKDREAERGSIDSVDLAPSRAYRRSVADEEPADDLNHQANSADTNEVSRQQSMTSIALDEESPTLVISTDAEKKETKEEDERQDEFHSHVDHPTGISDVSAPIPLTKKATASPAFRVPDFKWGSILIKLLNDLIFSIECDLYQWRCNAKLASLDAPPFLPKTASTLGNSSNANNSTNPAPKTQIESVLQKPENQIYIINVVHLISQLADNVIIAAGGLLPLLADATGGTRSSSAPSPSNPSLTPTTHEGLTMAQANSLLYRLITMVDMVVFAASHINLGELETDKNTTSGGILRQCLRLACTVTVKNCLVLRAWSSKVAGSEQYIMMVPECPKDMFDSYQGCSLLSANGLFEQSALKLDETDLIANLEYSPHQNPNTSSMPSFLPFQTSPIKDPNKLLQIVDIQRIQACIYHTGSTESRQSQFLALSSLYFISVLMVSKYRDIIEPKHKPHRSKSSSNQSSPAPSLSGGRAGDTSPVAGETSSTKATLTGQTSVSSIEANLLNFGKMQPNNSSGTQPQVAPANSSLTDMLTTKLENTLDSVCPLLKTIMCDFCAFLSKTLIGSHGQDLVNKEADRTFRRANASPVEVVMLLCSQEWQNTLQKNAGLAFIELINEGRVLSHGMKDHIVRVAMEADFILRRLRADDVAKHEHFGLACSESLSARLHEEVLINSLISSAARRDYVLYCKFREVLQKESQQNYKLDIWEDDDRRKRRYVFDSWNNATQIFYSAQSAAVSEGENKGESAKSNTDTKRILELQKTIELGGIQEQCTQASAPRSRSVSAGDSDADNYDDDEDDPENGRDSNSPNSDIAANNRKHSIKDSGGVAQSANEKGTQWAHDAYHQQQQQSNLNQRTTDKNEHLTNEPVGISDELKSDPGIWEYDECGSVNDFTGSVIFAAEALLVWSIYAIPGVLQVTTHELHFEPNQNITEAIDALKREDSASEHHQHDNQGDSDENCIKLLKPTNQNETLSPSEQIPLRKIDLKALRYCDFLTCNGKILLSDIRAIFSRHYLLQPNALEIFVSQRTSVMFAFADFDIVKRIVKYLPPVGVGIKYGIPQSRRSSLMSPRQLFAASNMTQRWQKREISNFQYLIFLNTIAGRTYQDLNQYPVFPWILTDYESDELDLNLPKNFRDLSKPIGALNNKRRNEFIERYQSWDNPKVPAFHYGTHYSTAAFTLNWLCRLRGTYNSSYLALQDSKYEESSRLFLSIGDSWVSSLSGGHQNVKELIPEFFYLPEMFHSNLGLAEVEYPPWAKSGEQFVRMHRIALESELVSCQLHQWIDLIFGYKQRGPEAINAVNTFYYLTYQGNVNLNMVQDPSLREAIETQIKHFGQTPSQLTTEPHPPRFSALHASPLMYSTTADEINKVVKFPFNNPIVHISSCINDYIAMSAASGADSASSGGSSVPGSSSAASPSSVLTITSNNQYQIHKWLPDDQSGHPFLLDPQLESALANGSSSSALRRQLIDVEDLCSGITLKLTNLDGPSSYQSSGDVMSEVQWPCAHHIVTLNGRYIIMGSFYDNSFRVFTTESGKLCQVIYGHRGFITCITRSEGNAAADFYIATGGQDCALLIWAWNERYAQVEGSGVSAVQNPLPKLSICGHRSAVLSAMICSELGLVVSGSKNLILVHTLTSGENLLQINMQLPDIMERTLNESKLMHQLVTDSTASIVQRPQVQDKHKTILEASMLGDGGRAASGRQQQADEKEKVAANPRSESPARRVKEERFSQLRDLCCSDYYITSLQFAREPAFIVCVALPPPQRRSKTQATTTTTTADVSESRPVHCNPPALLLTFNLKGSLMDSTPIGHSSISSPKLDDICALQVSRDGEYLVLNDSPITIKIYRTFGLQPLYAYNTNDVPSVVGSEEQNRIRSLALLDHRYILAGLDNGRLIVYNCDFKKL